MATEHHFYMNTTAPRHELRDTLVQADIGLEAAPDWQDACLALSAATNVTIFDDLGYHRFRPDNGVVATCSVTFCDRRLYLHGTEVWPDFETQTVLGVLALLNAYPQADAFWEAYDARLPVLLRREGRLVLAQALTKPGRFWDPERQPYRALVDLPSTVEPLGPWEDVETGVQKPGHSPECG